jgi:ABC-type transporter Mla subunit MlaD
MWTPLSLPRSALELISRAAADMARGLDLLEDLNDNAYEGRRLLAAGIERMDSMNAKADLVLDELAAAREVFAEAMLKVDRLSEQTDRVLAQIANAERHVATLTGGGDDLVAAATAAREQLRETQGVLEEANQRFGRALEMAEPLDRMTTRAARIAGSLRRDTGAD